MIICRNLSSLPGCTLEQLSLKANSEIRVDFTWRLKPLYKKNHYDLIAFFPRIFFLTVPRACGIPLSRNLNCAPWCGCVESPPLDCWQIPCSGFLMINFCFPCVCFSPVCSVRSTFYSHFCASLSSEIWPFYLIWQEGKERNNKGIC